METIRFDAIVRTLAAGHSRRGLFGLIAASGVNWLGLTDASAKKRKKKRKKKNSASPSPSSPPPPSSPLPCATTCAGCCAGDGTCQAGTTAAVCGTGGETCAACAAGEGCQGGECVTLPCGAGGPCLVFATSTKIYGQVGGLQGGDNLCQFRAANALPAPLPGTYKAWLATQAASPATRFVQSTGPYRLVNGTTIANNWADLTDGSLAAPIDITEHGTAFSDQFTNWAWTNVATNGTSSGAKDCAGWNSPQSFDDGGTGATTSSGATWTDYLDDSCGAERRLYCFQQS